MKVGIVGTRGIPAVYGGFETFAEQISPLLVKHGYDVTVYCDSQKGKKNYEYAGVTLVYQKTNKSNHSLLFYLEGMYRSLKNEEVIIVAGTGGSFFYFLNAFFKKIIITNTDGVESRRAKWSKSKRFLIKLSESLAVRNSNHIVADSVGIKNYLLDNYNRLEDSKVDVIEYGAPVNLVKERELLKKYNLNHKDYFLVVSRLEPENNLHLILEGYQRANTKKPLIIVGNKLNNDYVRDILRYESKMIRFIGGIYNQQELKALRFSSFGYIHGHSVGGTNPSLLEALGSKNICICHDNIFNREVTSNNQLYFSTYTELKYIIENLENSPSFDLEVLEDKAIERIETYYTWDKMALKYVNLLDRYEAS